MTPIHVADSVRIALGNDEACQALLKALETTALPAKACGNLDELVEFKPSVIVMDAALARSPGLELIRESLPDIPVIAPTACEPAAEFPMPNDVDDQLRLIRPA